MYQTNERIDKGQTKATLTEVASHVLVAALMDLASSRMLVAALMDLTSSRMLVAALVGALFTDNKLRHTEVLWFGLRSNPVRCISVPRLFLECVVLLQVNARVCEK